VGSNPTLSATFIITLFHALTLIIPARKGLFLKDIFEIVGILLLDKDAD
jgi:hypothetical protein